MRIKLFLIICVLLGYLAVSFGPVTASQLYRSAFFTTTSFLVDGVDPPHAVDTSGKAIPPSGATQPDKPIILSKDSQDDNWGEFLSSAPFDHTKHTTGLDHSIDGKTLTSCVECHHTAQPSAPKGQEYLTKFTRKEVLTAKQLDASKEAVQSCRACHFQSATAETAEYPPMGVTYPKSMNKKPSGKLTNDVAYHENCISCHKAAVSRDAKLKAPLKCGECHVVKP